MQGLPPPLFEELDGEGKGTELAASSLEVSSWSLRYNPLWSPLLASPSPSKGRPEHPAQPRCGLCTGQIPVCANHGGSATTRARVRGGSRAGRRPRWASRRNTRRPGERGWLLSVRRGTACRLRGWGLQFLL